MRTLVILRPFQSGNQVRIPEIIGSWVLSGRAKVDERLVVRNVECEPKYGIVRANRRFGDWCRSPARGVAGSFITLKAAGFPDLLLAMLCCCAVRSRPEQLGGLGLTELFCAPVAGIIGILPIAEFA